MEHSVRPSASKRGKLACTECRQQKAKCDAHVHPGRPCTRCVKVNAQCTLSGRFRRENKRQRLSELQQETNELRRKLRSSQMPKTHDSSPIAMLTAAAELSANPATSTSASGSEFATPPLTSVSSSYPQPQPQPPPSLRCAGLGSQGSRTEAATAPAPASATSVGQRIADQTLSRSLNGVELSGGEIDEIFQLFFDQYAQFLPILDPRTTPNSYYAQSPFLFWAVIGVACRNYPRNPTLLTALMRRISELALLSVVSASPFWNIIQGLLLLLTWPMPKDPPHLDVAFPLSGMLLHIAMQNGLHIPMSSHEFCKARIPAPSEADMIRRSELWVHCVIVYQRECAAKGQYVRPLIDFGHDAGQSQVPFKKIAPSLLLKVRCQETIAQCSAAVIENGLRTMSPDQERALDILLRTFEGQINGLEAQSASEDDRYNTMHCRLCIQVFHFFKNQTISSTGCLPRILNTACTVIELTEKLGERVNALSTAPVHVAFGLLVALVALVRILKSSAARDLDIDRSKSCFFKGINLSKRLSVVNYDTPAKSVVVMNQLWHSSKAFRRSDGSEYTALRIRSRLVLSPVLDAVWWWRDEFDPQYRPTTQSSQEDASDGAVENRHDLSRSAVHAPAGPVERHEPVLFDDHFLADFEWALGDDELFPPPESYGPTWPFGNLL